VTAGTEFDAFDKDSSLRTKKATAAQIALRHFLARDAERRIQLVHIAVRGHAKVVLAHPRPAEEACRAVVPATRVDLCQAASVPG